MDNEKPARFRRVLEPSHRSLQTQKNTPPLKKKRPPIGGREENCDRKNMSDRLADFERFASPPHEPPPIKTADVVRFVGDWAEHVNKPRPNITTMWRFDKKSLAIAKQIGKHLTNKTQIAMFYSYALREDILTDNDYFSPYILKSLKEDYLPQMEGWK